MTFQRGASGSPVPLNQASGGFGASNPHINQVNFNEVPSLGFNSTSERFSYMKEMQKLGENPGPGSYMNQENDKTTIAKTTMPEKNFALNTISSTFNPAANESQLRASKFNTIHCFTIIITYCFLSVCRVCVYLCVR